MGSEKKEYFYEVAVILPATWKNNVYTYKSNDSLGRGQIVIVPFGNSQKLGLVQKTTQIPEFEAKEIQKYTGKALPVKTMDLLHWMTIYYPGSPGSSLQNFIPSFLINNSFNDIDYPKTIIKKEIEQKLTPKQAQAVKSLNNSTSASVLHGVTGSGKTRIYSELALEQLKSGKDVLILYPEISLTSQLKKSLEEYLGKSIVNVYHSKQKKSLQIKTWMSVEQSREPKVIIGPRSALFLPYSNLGLIVVDEVHDGAYKQDSGTRYSALSVAGKLAGIHSAKLVLGSATPPIQETQQILSKGGNLVCLHETAIDTTEHGEVDISVIDLKKKESFKKSYMISDKLVDEITKSLNGKGQTLLFLNRRGTARMLLCEKCGWHAECSNCDLPLTYHHDTHKMMCHICGRHHRAPQVCPDCSNQITQKTPGTKAIESELSNLFPDAKIERFDSDNKKKDSFVENFERIKNGDVDIILGTQLLTKGLDLPLLDTVGILNADSALLLPDYSSQERAFQQLTQVSGRVGRGHRHGTIVIQTYQPESPLLKLVSSGDWHGFYNKELKVRDLTGYPPYSFAMKVWVNKPSRESSIKAIEKVLGIIKHEQSFNILGPAPSFYEKNNSKYTWQIVILSKSRQKLLDSVKNFPQDAIFDLDPSSLL